VILTITATCTGAIVGIIVALLGMSTSRLLSGVAVAYVWFFRGIPALVQILFWFNLAALFPHLSLGIPFGPAFVTLNANKFVTSFIAADLGLGLCEAAYMSEIFRTGVQSVGPGQFDASRSLGLSRFDAMRCVILPQALRIIVPPMGNQLIGMLKYTSLASVVATTELLESAELIYQRNFEIIPLLLVATLWYLILTVLLTLGQRALERRLARSVRGPGKPGTMSIWGC
jgi:polar amino acid transport system permease protein